MNKPNPLLKKVLAYSRLVVLCCFLIVSLSGCGSFSAKGALEGAGTNIKFRDKATESVTLYISPDLRELDLRVSSATSGEYKEDTFEDGVGTTIIILPEDSRTDLFYSDGLITSKNYYKIDGDYLVDGQYVENGGTKTWTYYYKGASVFDEMNVHDRETPVFLSDIEGYSEAVPVGKLDFKYDHDLGNAYEKAILSSFSAVYDDVNIVSEDPFSNESAHALSDLIVAIEPSSKISNKTMLIGSLHLRGGFRISSAFFVACDVRVYNGKRELIYESTIYGKGTHRTGQGFADAVEIFVMRSIRRAIDQMADNLASELHSRRDIN